MTKSGDHARPGTTSAAKASPGKLPARASSVRVLGGSRAGYFTLKVRHFVAAAAVLVVLATVACRR